MVTAGPQPGGRWIAANATVDYMLRLLYPEVAPTNHLFGGPDWVRRTRFDITAVGAGNPGYDALNEMARQMLVDRFGLKHHLEERELEVNAMVLVSRDGVRGRAISPAAVDCGPYFAARIRRETPPPLPPRKPGGPPPCGASTLMVPDMPVMHLQAGGMTMEQIATFMVGFDPGRTPVVDRTGLAGRYDIDMKFEVAQRLSVTDSASGVPRLPEAMADQLGLRLERRRERFRVLVIDQISEPSPD